jgi:hypothetical protein
MISLTPTPRRVLAGAALGCLAALVTACGTSGSPAAAPTVTKTVTVPATPAPTTAPAPSSPATSPAPGPCPTSGLHAHLGLTQGAAGSAFTVIDFTNVSGSTCNLYGYPGISFVTSDGGGRIVGAPAARNSPPAARLVMLAPGETGNALLRITDAGVYPPSRCKAVSVHWLQIYPPNQTAALFLAFNTTTCSKSVVTLHVDVVVPGSGGST